MQTQDSSYKLFSQRLRSRALAAYHDLEVGTRSLRQPDIDEDVRLQRQLGQLDIVITSPFGEKTIIPGVNLMPIDIYYIEPESGFNFRFSCTPNTLQTLTTSFSGTNFTYTATTSETGYATFIYSSSGTQIGDPVYVDNIIGGVRNTLTGVPSGVTSIGVIFICASSPAITLSINSATALLTNFPNPSATVPGTSIPHTITNTTSATALSITAFNNSSSQHTPFILPANSTTFANGFSSVFSTPLIVLDPDTTYPLTDNELSTDVYLVTISLSPLETLSLPFSVECSAAGNGYISFVLYNESGPLLDEDQPQPVALSGPFNQLVTIDPLPQDITAIYYYYAEDPIILAVDSFPYTPESVDWFKVYKFENNSGNSINITYTERDDQVVTFTLDDGLSSNNITFIKSYTVIVTPLDYYILTPNDAGSSLTTISGYTGGDLAYRGSVDGTGYVYFEYYNNSNALISGSYTTISASSTTTISVPSGTVSIKYKFYENLVDIPIDNDLSNGLDSSTQPFVPIRFQNTGDIPIKITVTTSGDVSTNSTTVQPAADYTFDPPLGYTDYKAIKQYTVSPSNSTQTLGNYTGGNFEIKAASLGTGWITFIYTQSAVVTYVRKTITTSDFTAVTDLSFDTGTDVEFAFYSTRQTFTITNAMATGLSMVNAEPYIPYNTITNSASSPGAVEIELDIVGSSSTGEYINPELAKTFSVIPTALNTRPFITSYMITRLYTIPPANGAQELFNDNTIDVETIKYKYASVGVTGSTIYFSDLIVLSDQKFKNISDTYTSLTVGNTVLTAYYYSTAQPLIVNTFTGVDASSKTEIATFTPYGYVENATAYDLNITIYNSEGPNITITRLTTGGVTDTYSPPIYRYYENYDTTLVYLPTTGDVETTLADYIFSSAPVTFEVPEPPDGTTLRTSNLYLTGDIDSVLIPFVVNTSLDPIDLTLYTNDSISFSLPDTLTVQSITNTDIGTTITLSPDKAYTFTNSTSPGESVILTFTRLSGPPPVGPETVLSGDSYTPTLNDQLGYTSVEVVGSTPSFTLTCSSADPPAPTNLIGYTGGAFSYKASANPTVPYITFNFLTSSGPGSDVQYDISTNPATITPAPNVTGAAYIFACNYFNANITSVPVSNVTLGTFKPWSFTNSTGDDIVLTILIHPIPSNISYTKTLAAGATFYPTPTDGPSNNGGPYNLAAYSAVASGPGPTTITIVSIFDSGPLTDTTEYTFDNTIVNTFSTVPAIIITLTKTDTTTITSPLVTTSWTPTPTSGYIDYSVAYPEYTLTADPGGSEQTISGWTTDEKTISYKADTLGADITQVFFIYYDGSTEISSELKPIDTTNNTVDIPDATTIIAYRLYDSLQSYEIGSLASSQTLYTYTPYGTFLNSLDYDIYISADHVDQQLVSMFGITTTGIPDYYNNSVLNIIIVLQDVGTTETLISPWDSSFDISLTCPDGFEGTITIYYYDGSDNPTGILGPSTVSNGGIGLITNTLVNSADVPPGTAYIQYTASYTPIP